MKRGNKMPQYFNCFDCSRISPYKQNNNVCPLCGSKNGTTLTDEEFRRMDERGVISLINPSTGKPFKKK